MTRPLVLSLTLLALSGCANDVDLGGNRDAGRDGGMFTPRADECGNGIDDDQNGRIDDGCYCGAGDVQSCFSGAYPGHGVGACRDGMQTCDVQEFGDWGMFSCAGEALPSPELCDDIDNDCDGAVDEDCACTAGSSRMCSDAFVTAPCTPGTQTCRTGTWSRCEGAVMPSADVCGDAIDNDCDGLTNEGCTCTSTPEVCSDRIDNDCDGDVDEVICATAPDAGMFVVDAMMSTDAASSTPGVDAGPDSGCVDGGWFLCGAVIPDQRTDCPATRPTPGTACRVFTPVALKCGYAPFHSQSVDVYTCRDGVWGRPTTHDIGMATTDPDPSLCPSTIPEHVSACSMTAMPPIAGAVPVRSGSCKYHEDPLTSLVAGRCQYVEGNWVWLMTTFSY